MFSRVLFLFLFLCLASNAFGKDVQQEYFATFGASSEYLEENDSKDSESVKNHSLFHSFALNKENLKVKRVVKFFRIGIHKSNFSLFLVFDGIIEPELSVGFVLDDHVHRFILLRNLRI